jgi:hypothetical protein
MITVSLLLILVAVALLALGLTSGSSGLLIASIVASLIAAIALVIGARRNAGARRAATAVTPRARPAAPAEPAPAYAEAPDVEPQFAAEPDFSAPPAPAAAESVTYTEEPVDEIDDFGLDDEAPWRTQTREQVYATQATPETEVLAATGPDYDRAASAIHSARSEQPDENAWRRDTHAEAAAQTGLNEPDPNAPDLNRPDLNRPDLNRPDLNRPDLGGAGLSDEFAEADADDPDDEPLPQSVQPADAVRVARMDAEVLVVDGRPRYHLADCPHLVGRLTEPIPVNEAVELGFSPCGLCRPVDRLVAAEARR